MKFLLMLALALGCLGPACANQPDLAPASTPRRVVALAPNLAETWAFACGPEALVGRVNFTDFPPALEALPSVGSALGPDLERLSSLRPDLVLITRGAAGGPVATALAGAGLRLEVFQVESPAQVVQAVQRMEQLCNASGLAAQNLTRELAAAPGVGAGTPPRVLMLHGHRPLVAAGPGSWGESLLTLAGATNAVPPTAMPYPTLSAEDLAALAPDCILDSSGMYEAPADAQALQLPGHTPLVPLEDSALLRPGPRFPQAVEAVRRALLQCQPKISLAAPLHTQRSLPL